MNTYGRDPAEDERHSKFMMEHGKSLKEHRGSSFAQIVTQHKRRMNEAQQARDDIENAELLKSGDSSDQE